MRSTWLWVDPLEPGSDSSNDFSGGQSGNFNESHQVFLENLGITGPFYHDQIDNAIAGYQPLEKGAAAISDLSTHFQWIDNSCRVIFYISDTNLAGYYSDLTLNNFYVDQAISIANANYVNVYAHRVDPETHVTPLTTAQMDANYIRLCDSTGGQAIIGGTIPNSSYDDFFSKILCRCSQKCKEVKKPDIEPCIKISYGKSKCDGLDSDDIELFCISICNCYSNVTFSNFAIAQLRITQSDGTPLPTLPSGDFSISTIPIGPICFGDIAPCNDDKPHCISRQFAIKTLGASPGNYKIHLEGISYGVTFCYETKACFDVTIC